MNLGSTCLGSKLERRCLQQYKKVSERGCFQLTKKVPDSSVFCCASPPKKDGQVFQAADVASHQDFGFQTIKGWARSGTFLARRVFLNGAVTYPWMMLQYKAWSGCFESRHGWRLCQMVVRLSSRMCMRLQVRAPRSLNCMRSTSLGGKSRCVSGAAESAAGESKGTFGLHEVNETDRMGTVDAVAAANAGETKGIIGMPEGIESDFSKNRAVHPGAAEKHATAGESEEILGLHVSPSSLHNSSNSRGCVAAVACARLPAVPRCICTCLPRFFIFCCVCCCCTCALHTHA